MTEAPSREQATRPRGLRRSSEGRFLMGVCAGMGRYTGVDPVVFRVGFAVLLLGSGVGLFLYIAAFLLMKEPNGKPGLIEQWTRRDFDAETVMALLTAVLAFGLAINLASVWLDTGTLVVGVLLAVSLLAAHANGVDLKGLARSMPERLSRRAGPEQAAPPYEPGRRVPSMYPQPRPEPVHPYAPQPPTEKLQPTARPQKPLAAETAAETAPETDAETVTQAPTEQGRTGEDTGEGAGGGGEEERPGATQLLPAAPSAPTETETETETGTETEVAPEGPVARTAEIPSPTRLQPAAPYEEPATSHGDQARSHDEQAASHGEQAASHAASARSYRDQAASQSPSARSYRDQAPPPRQPVGYGEPFAPNGPFRPLDPGRRPGYSPYDPALYGRPVPRRERRPRPRSFIGVITILLAFIIGGIVMLVQAKSAGGVSPTVVGGAVLVTIGAGLLVAAWWGRGAGLVAAGTTVAMLLAMTMMLGDLPKWFGDSHWHPLTTAEAGLRYDVGVGDGRLDLSDLKLEPGSRVTFNATVALGTLRVIVPPQARVEVHATNRIGDVKVDHSLRGGVDVDFRKVLEPEVTPRDPAATIVLNLRGGVGDMEVRRAA
ncbi:PspC domain-containing protein [Nonomuraea pusilla]|uniref:PspC domain-containing protein n=1 Tax=Nonomuraea pusilla TaxID=46177 RepID=UPI0033285B1A